MGKPRKLKVYLLNRNKWLLFVLLFILVPIPLAIAVNILNEGNIIPSQLIFGLMFISNMSAVYVPYLLAGRWEIFEFTDEGMAGPTLSVEWRAIVSFHFGVWGRGNKLIFKMNDGTKVKFYGVETLGKREDSFWEFQNMVLAYLRRYNARNGIDDNDTGGQLITRAGALMTAIIFTAIGILFLAITADGENFLKGALFSFMLAAIFWTMFLYSKKKRR